MRVNGDFLEVECCQKNKAGQIVCGDTFLSRKFKAEGRVISVLSDGLGSGIKASVLSTLTASMLQNFSIMNEDIIASATSIIRTLPQDTVRKISYSTFCISNIDCFGNVRIAEYETPSFYLVRNGAFLEIPKKQIPIEREDSLEDTCLWISEFHMEKEDRIIFFSDGVSQSGMGSRVMPFGWGEGIRSFIASAIAANPDVSAKELANRIVLKAEQNDALVLKDDTTCCVIYMRKPRNLLICTGPPYDEKRDRVLSDTLMRFQGRRVICGGTTAQIVARETERKITMDMDFTDHELPPVSHMEGVDLITEGILTLSKVERLLSDDSLPVTKEGPAEKMIRMLADSDRISFLVGTRINTAHQDPTLPVELEIRRNVVKKIKATLEDKWLKVVDIKYI